MADESLIIRSILGFGAAIALVLFFFAGGLKGVADAFALFGIATGAFIVLKLFFIESGDENVIKGGLLSSVLVIGSLIILMDSGLLSLGVILLLIVATLLVAPGFKNDEGNEWAILAATLIVLLFLSKTQGLLPAILRAHGFAILIVGVLALILFWRIKDKEIRGITAAGLMFGTVLTLLGLYLVLF